MRSIPVLVVSSLVVLLKNPSRRTREEPARDLRCSGAAVALTLLPALLFALCSAACQSEPDSPTITQPIVNGAIDSSNLYPYVDRLTFASANVPAALCSGVLIGARTVLTAAHCIPPAPVTGQFSGTNGLRRPFSRVSVHPEYQRSNVDDQHDVAAVFLDEAASSHPVGLEYFSAERQLMTFVGLGRTSLADDAPIDERRRYITIDVGPRGGGAHLSGTHSSKSVAPGDSGGALLKNGRLVGVISNVLEDDDSVQSSAVTVFRNREWILERLFENRDGAPIYWSAGRMSRSEALFRGESLYSGNGFVRLTLQFNGDLVLTQGARDVWRSGTAGSSAFSATMQRDGNLVLYNALGNVVWALNRFDSSGDPTLAVQNDGNLVQYSASGAVYWAANTNLAGPAGCRRLTSDRALHRGNSLYSCGGQFRLTMQPDGNLVLYYPSPVPGDLGARWSSGTFGTTGYVATMQPDGNFVVYNLVDSPVWSTGTVRNPGAVLDLQNDGNVVVYPPGGGPALWASNSTLPAPTGCGGMDAGYALSAGQSIYSCNGRLRLTMQPDGNLVLYANGTANGTVALWASNTYGSGGYVATLQPDGNFVVYGMPDDGPRWSTGTQERWSHLSLHDDGELVLYAGMFPVWSTRTSLPPCAVTCGTRCCPSGSWCGTGNRCCTSCTAGCPCFGSELSLTTPATASRCPLDGATLAAGEGAEASCAIESAPAEER